MTTMLLLAGSSLAATLTVGPSGAFATIGDAEAAASSGDTLQIEAGTWAEDLAPAGKDLTYSAPAGATITGATADPCLSAYDGETVRVEGLTFSGCAHAVAGAYSTITLSGVTVESGACAYGCGVDVTGGTVDVEDSTFTGNQASGLGGSLYADGGADVTVRRSVFSGGMAVFGADLAFSDAGEIVVEDTVSTDADASQDGGAVYVSGGGDLTISGSTFTSASAGAQGGAVYAYRAGVVRISETAFSAAAAGSRGGALALSSTGDVTLTDVTVSACSAGSEGGGVYVTDAALSLVDTRLEANTSVYGGGLYASPGSLTLTDVELLDNEATVEGGGAWVIGSHTGRWDMVGGRVEGNRSAGDGGGLYVNDYEPVSIAGVAFLDNRSGGSGGGAFLHGNYGTYGPTEVDTTRFVGNVATSGGGLWSQYTAELDVTACVFFENEASGSGGGLGTEDTAVSIAGLLAAENTAADGAAVMLNTSYLSVTHGTFACNDAGSGRDVVASGASSLTFSANVVAGNLGATAIYSYGAAGTRAGNVVWDNAGTAWTGLSDPTGSDDNVATDPGLAGYVCDGAWAGDDYTPAAGGHVVDAWASETDVDGSTADLGAYGGPDGDLDADGDGWGHWDGDCDEGDDAVYPGAAETWYDGLDGDCAGDDDDDQDADGYAFADDCDDTDATMHPGAADTWYDGVDSDCAGDDDDDQDADGYALDDDCDDADAAVYPGAPDTWYDGLDSDCAENDDDDQDRDGAPLAEDCDDTDGSVYPGALDEFYDGIDADCAGGDDFDQDHDGFALDEDCDDEDDAVYPGAQDTWYDDLDSDCAGNDDFDRDSDGARVDVDCDDDDATVYPGAPDTWYDGVDSDCARDDDDDQDADGYVLVNDCDDTDATMHPGADDAWYDGVDSDCANNDDDDQDGDTHGVGTDCDDVDATVFPGAPEIVGDGLDQDCDGVDLVDSPDETTRTLVKVGGGCACDAGAGPGPGGFVAALLGAALVLRRRRSVAALLLVAPAALAADGTGLRADSPRVGSALTHAPLGAPSGAVDVALGVGRIGDSVVATWSDGEEEVLLGGVSTATLSIGWAPVKRAYVDASLPLVLGASHGAPAPGDRLDARLGVGFAAIEGEDWRFGPRLSARLPTSSAGPYASAGGVQGQLDAAVETTGLVRLSVRAGMRLGGRQGDGLLADRAPTPWTAPVGLAARFPLPGPLELGAELDADLAPPVAEARYLRAEGVAYAALPLSRVDIVAGAGGGFAPGVGTPTSRVLLAVRGNVLPGGARAAGDRDGDHVADDRDACLGEKEDADGFQDGDGCPDLDNDLDGVPDKKDACPDDPEDEDGMDDGDGCVDPDDDKDGVPDGADACRRVPGPAATQGCPAR